MELDQIKELIAMLENSKLRRLAIKQGDFEVQLEKEGSMAPATSRSVRIVEPLVEHTESHAKGGDRAGKENRSERVVEGHYITSPMVGTFYASASPDQPSFVKVSDQISEDRVVCIIEAMKVMNEVKANVSGTVVEILVENGHPVEFGSKMFRVI